MNENEIQFQTTEATEETPIVETVAEVTEDAPIVEQTSKAKGKFPKKALVIAAAIVALAAILGAIIIGSVSSSPLGLIATGFANSMEAIENNPAVTLLDKASNGGSIAFSMNLKTLLAGMGLPLDGSGSVKIYTDAENQKAVAEVGVLLGQAKTLDATLFASQDTLVLSSQWLLGEKAYGVDLHNLADAYNNSVFGPNGKYSLGIELPENFDTVTTGSVKYREDTEALMEKVAPRLLKIIEENTTAETANSSLTLGGQEVKTTAVTMKMDSRQLAALAADLIEYLRNDANIRKYVEENVGFMLWASGENMITEAVVKNAVEAFYQELDKAAAEMDQTAKEMEESQFSMTITFHISKSGKQLIGFEQSGQVDGETGKLCLYAGPDLKEAKEIYFQASTEDGTYLGTYQVTVNDKDAFASQLLLKEDDETVFQADLRWNKQDSTVELSATNELGSNFALRGTLEQADKATTCLVESVALDGDKADLGLTVTICTSDKMPATPEYADLLKMAEAEVDKLMEGLGTVLLQLLYGMM